MERKSSDNLTAVPKVIYGPRVNETTPYLVRINPSRYGDLLRTEFGMSDDQIRSVETTILDEDGVDRLGEAFYRSDGWSFRRIYTTKIFMGTHWNLANSPKYAGFFDRKSRWDQTKRRILKTVIHESQHNKDHMVVTQYNKQPLSDLANFALWASIGGFSNYLKKSKASNIAFGIGSLFLAKAGYSFLKSSSKANIILANIQERAREAENIVDLGKWSDIVEFRPR